MAITPKQARILTADQKVDVDSLDTTISKFLTDDWDGQSEVCVVFFDRPELPRLKVQLAVAQRYRGMGWKDPVFCYEKGKVTYTMHAEVAD